MRVYLGGLTRPQLKKCHQIAPSHIYGGVWTPHDRSTPNEIPFIVDNGAYTGTFDPGEWTGLLDTLTRYNYGPDFVVLPDRYNDAEGTLERHRQFAPEVLNRHLTPAAVIQPGLPVEIQVSLADRIGAKFVFVGGENKWKRAMGAEIVEEAHGRDLRVHIGNPGGQEGLVWAYKIGADSADTSTITQNGYWHYLEKLKEVTQDHSKGPSYINEGRQSSVTDDFVAGTDGGNLPELDTGTDCRDGDEQ